MPIDPGRVRDVFLAAAELPAGVRPLFLAEACGGDAGLLAAVERLLAAHAAPAAVLDPPPAPSTGTFDHATPAPDSAPVTGSFDPALPPTAEHKGPAESVGRVIAGKYKLVEEVGEGGMGSVYLAQQTEPVKRLVAVKVIKAGMDSKAVLARFDAERQALAMMDHPNIARVLDAGTTESGRPFFVMELVKGTPITKFCDERKLTPRQRLELFVPVCQAIQHAHQKGIIHRDIKPSNVLVALYDDRPVPKVIDFGVAKATGPQLTEYTLVTGIGAVVGTPEYMSPEQASFNNLDVDTRSDIYSLGVLLYELLTGTTPLDRKSLGKAALLEVLRMVREVEAPRPSNKLSTSQTLPTISANRGLEPAKLTRLLRGELDWIVMKALEKDRNRRYETANGFAMDVQRYLAGEPVQAVPPSVGYRVRKFLRKHRGPVVAASVVLVALFAGIVGTVWGLVEARNQRDHAEAERQAAEAARGLEAEARAKVEEREKLLEKQKTLLEEQKQAADAARLDADLELHDNQRTMLAQAWEGRETAKLRALLDQMRPKPGKTDLRGFETHYLDRISHPAIDCQVFRVTEPSNSNDVWSLAGSFGRVRLRYQVAANNHYYTIDALDLATGKTAAGFAPIRGRGGNNGTAFVSPGDPPRLFVATAGPYYADGNAQEEMMLFGMPLQDITAWDARTGRHLGSCDRLTPDEGLLAQGWRHRFLMFPISATANRDASVVMTQMTREVKGDGAGRAYESRLQLHELKTGRAVRCLDARPGVIDLAQFSFDDRHIVTSHKRPGPPEKHTVTVWDAASGQALWSHDARLMGFTLDGQYVGFETPPTPGGATPPAGPMKVFRVATGEPVELPTREPLVAAPPPPEDPTWESVPRLGKVGANAERIAGVLGNLGFPLARLWLNDRGEVVVAAEVKASVLRTYGMNQVTDYVVSTCRPPRVDVYAFSAPGFPGMMQPSFRQAGGGVQLLTTTRHSIPVYPCLPPFQQITVTVLESFDLATRQRTRAALPPWVGLMYQSANHYVRGRTVLSKWPNTDYSGSGPDAPKVRPAFTVHDLQTGKPRFSFPVNRWDKTRQFPNGPVELSPDGTALAVIAPGKNEVQLLDAETGTPKWTFALPDEGTTGYQLLFLPDGSRLVLADRQNSRVQVLDATSGQLVRQIDNVREKPPEEPHAVGFLAVHLTPDGRLLLCQTPIGGLHVIDLADGTVRQRLPSPRKKDFDPNQGGSPPHWSFAPEVLSNRFILLIPGSPGASQISTGEYYEVWSLETGTRVSRFELKPQFGLTECVFSEDGSRLFVLGNGVVHVVDLRRGREVLRIPRGTTNPSPNTPPRYQPSHMSLSPDGYELTVYVADPEAGTVTKRVHDGRPLSEEELARARRIHDIQTRLPEPPKPEDKPPVTASDYFDLAQRSVPQERVAALREAIKLDPGFPVLHAQLAMALEQTGDADGALAAYRELIRLAPRDVFSHWQIGQMLERRRDFAGAAAAYREAVRHASGDTVGYAGMSPPPRDVLHNALAYALRELGDLEAAEKEYREAIRLQPKNHWYVTQLGVCLLRQGMVKEADAEVNALVKSLEDQRRKEPGNPETLGQLAGAALDIGAMYLWQDRYQEAADWSEQATQLYTEYYRKLAQAVPDTQKQLRWTHWNRGVALNWLDRGKEALAEMELSIRYTPEAERLNPRMICARYMAKSGDHKGAVAKIKELIGTPPGRDMTRWFYWDAALAYALSVDLVKGDEKLRAEYTEAAIALLKQTIAEAGFDDVAILKKDADLNPIRHLPEFQQIVADLEKKFPPPKPKAPPPREKPARGSGG